MDLLNRARTFWRTGTFPRRGTIVICTIDTVFDGLKACMSFKEALFVKYMMDIAFITPYMLPLVMDKYYKHIYETIFFFVQFGLCILMFVGIARSKTNLILPWIINSGLMGILYFISDINHLINNVQSSMEMRVLHSVVIGFNAVIRGYYLTVVYSYYRELGGNIPFINLPVREE